MNKNKENIEKLKFIDFVMSLADDDLPIDNSIKIDMVMEQLDCLNEKLDCVENKLDSIIEILIKEKN
jgi:hypothetical protein